MSRNIRYPYRVGRVTVKRSGPYYRIRWREEGRDRERSSTDETEAIQTAHEIAELLSSGNSGTSSVSFAALADQATRRERFGGRGDTHWQNMRSILRIHIIPVLGDRKARQITARDFEDLIASVAGDGYSIHTVSKVRKLLVRIGKYGVREGIWTVAKNPADDLRIPGGAGDDQLQEVTTDRMPTDEQVARLLEVAWAQDKRYGFAVEMAANCGLRYSEILALRPKDIDLKAGVVQVTGTMKLANKKWSRDVTKTAAGRRAVPLSKSTVRRLKIHLKGLDPEQTIVATRNNTPISRSNFQKPFARLREEAGYPDHLSMHSMRHWYASRLLNVARVGDGDLASVLGHANPAITRKLYIHGDAGSVDRVRTALDNV